MGGQKCIGAKLWVKRKAIRLQNYYDGGWKVRCVRLEELREIIGME